MSALDLVPVSLAEANAFVAAHHRHSVPVVGHKWSVGVVDADGTLRGVAIVGRPVARHRDDGVTLEVTRLATDGTPNACSMLYAAAWRAARAMGYRRLGTYIRADEDGTSLRAAGWRPIAQRQRAQAWARPSRDREPQGDSIARQLWEAPALC